MDLTVHNTSGNMVEYGKPCQTSEIELSYKLLPAKEENSEFLPNIYDGASVFL